MGSVSTIRQEISSLVTSLTQADAILAKKGVSAQLVVSDRGRSIRPAEPVTPENRELNETCRMAFFESMVKSDSLSDAALSNVKKVLFGLSKPDYERQSGRPLTARTLKMIDLGLVMSEQGKQFSDLLSSVRDFAEGLAKTFAEKFTNNVYGTIYERLEDDFIEVASALVKKRGADVLSDSGDFVRMVENRVFAKNASLFETLDKAAAMMPKRGKWPDIEQAVGRTGLSPKNQRDLMVRYESMIRESLARQIVRDGGIDSPSRALPKAETEVIRFNNMLVTSVKALEKEFRGSETMRKLPSGLRDALEDRFVNDLQTRLAQACESSGFDESDFDKLLREFQKNKGVFFGYKEQAELVAECRSKVCEEIRRNVPEAMRPQDFVREIDTELLAKITSKDGLSCSSGELAGSVMAHFGSAIKNAGMCLQLKQGAEALVDSALPDLTPPPLLKAKLVEWVKNRCDSRLAEFGKVKEMNLEVERKAVADLLVKACENLLKGVAELKGLKSKVIDSLTNADDNSLRKRIGEAYDRLVDRQLDQSDAKMLSFEFNGRDVGVSDNGSPDVRSSVEQLAKCFKGALVGSFQVEILRANLDQKPEASHPKRRSWDDHDRARKTGGKDYDKTNVSEAQLERMMLRIEQETAKARRDSIVRAYGRDLDELVSIKEEELKKLDVVPESEKKERLRFKQGLPPTIMAIVLEAREKLKSLCGKWSATTGDKELSDNDVIIKVHADTEKGSSGLYARTYAWKHRILKTLELEVFSVPDDVPEDLQKAFKSARKQLSDAFHDAIRSPISAGRMPEDSFLDYFDYFQQALDGFKVVRKDGGREIAPEIDKCAQRLVEALKDAQSQKPGETTDERREKCGVLIKSMTNLTSAMRTLIDKASASALEKTLNERFVTDQQKTLLMSFRHESEGGSPLQELNTDNVKQRLNELGFSVEEALRLSVEEIKKLVIVKYSGATITSSTEPEVADLLLRIKDGSLPLREMTANRVTLLKSILCAKVRKSFLGKGFDTLDALSVYRSLAKNGLLSERLEVQEMKEDAVKALGQVLSLLYPLNGSRTDGLAVLGEQLLGMDVLEFAVKVTNGDKTAVRLLDELKGGRLKSPLGKVVGPAQEVMKFFKAGGSASDLIPKAAIVSATDLLGALRQLETRSLGARPGEIVAVEFKFGEVPVRLETKDGAFRVAFTVDGKSCPLACPFGVGTFADQLEKAIVSDVRRFGAGAALAVLDGAVGENDAKSLLYARDLALVVIQTQTGTPVAKLSHMGSAEVCELAKRVLERMNAGPVEKGVLAQEVEKAVPADSLQLNSADVVELCSRLEGVGKAVDDAVILPSAMKSGLRNGNEVREFAAELFLDAQSWREDVSAQNANERMLALLKSRSVVLSGLTSRPAGLDEFVVGTGDDRDESLKKAMQEIIKSLRTACDKREGTALTSDEVVRALESKGFAERDLSYLMTEVAKAQKSCIAKLQGLFARQFAGVLANAAPSSAPIEMQTLRQLAGAGSLDVNSGYGKFLMAAFDRYFTELNGSDGRAFLASVFRQTRSDADPVSVMTAMVKAAGPVFQKLIQGVPENVLPEELRPIVTSSKSSLSSISPEVVRAKLFNLVERSNGRITSIEVKRSLGAASVGEALLCVIRTKDNPVGEECVVKMMRPDVQTRAQREYALLSGIAGDVDETGGMKAAFASRFEGILEELDFAIEARNIELGRIYCGKADSFTSMSAHSLASSTSDMLILAKAEGSTFERFLGSQNTDVDAIAGHFTARTVDEVSGKLQSVVYTRGTAREMIDARRKLGGIYADLLTRQKALVDFSMRWTEEAIFTSGVFHGDLHGGNLMTSEHLLTVIDFGNVSRLEKGQRECLMGIVAACVLSDPSLFVEKYKALLSPEGRARIEKNEANRKAFEADVGAILKKGGGRDSMLRLSAIIRRLEKYEFEIPAPLFNFSQSMARLQDTLESVDATLRRVRAMVSDISFDKTLYEEGDGGGVGKKNPFDISAIMLRKLKGVSVKELEDDAFQDRIRGELNEDVIKPKLVEIIGRHLNSEKDFNQMIAWLDELYAPADVATGRKTESIMSETSFFDCIEKFNRATNRFGNEEAKRAFVNDMPVMISQALFNKVFGSIVDMVKKSVFKKPADYGERLEDLVNAHQEDVLTAAPSLMATAVKNELSGAFDTVRRVARDLRMADVLAQWWIEKRRIPHIDAERVKVAVRELLTLNDYEFTKNGFAFLSSNWSTAPDKRKSLFKKIDANLKWLDRRLPQLGFPEDGGGYRKDIFDFAVFYMGVRNGIDVSFGKARNTYEDLTDDDYKKLLEDAQSQIGDGKNPLDRRVLDVLKSWREEALAIQGARGSKGGAGG